MVCGDLTSGTRQWETTIKGEYLAGELSAADFTLYPEIALVLRMASQNPRLIPNDLLGKNIGEWVRRMEELPVVQKTWPPHWR